MSGGEKERQGERDRPTEKEKQRDKSNKTNFNCQLISYSDAKSLAKLPLWHFKQQNNHLIPISFNDFPTSQIYLTDKANETTFQTQLK